MMLVLIIVTAWFAAAFLVALVIGRALRDPDRYPY